MNSIFKSLPFNNKNLGGMLSFGVFAILLLIMIPVPPFILDILILINIAVSAVIFLMSLQAKNVLEFTVLPTMLIFTTLTRIVLNVSSSRLILGKATGGKVIDAIGNITIGGDYVVGCIVFLIITMIMFLVVNKGTERVSEVSARFILDGMPGKQMSIDADLNSGVIDIKAAQKRRMDLEKESDFYKSMDGASKFVKGDAIAGLIITFVNVIGGLIMGATRHGMTLGEAASKYTILSIGDGLVNQLPSLLIAAAAAFMVTRGNSKDGVGSDILIQFLKYKEPLRGISVIFAIMGVLSLLGVLDGIPFLVCFAVSGGAYALTLIDTESFKTVEDEDEDDVYSDEVIEQTVENVLFVDKIALFVGTNVVNAIVSKVDGRVQIADELKYRIEVLKGKIKKDYGLKIPDIRITDDDYIPSNSFIVRIANEPSLSINVKPNCVFASFFGADTIVDFGEEAEIKELNLKGYWISKDDQIDAEDMGAITHSVFDIIILYLEYMIENRLDKLVTREDIKSFKEEVQTYNSAIIEEITHKQIESSMIQKVIQNLLMEKISIKNLEFILECISDAYTVLSGKQLTVDTVTQYVRKNVAHIITEDKIEDNVLNVVVLGEESSQALLSKLRGDMDESIEMKCNNVYLQMATTHTQFTDMGQKFVFLCDKAFRADIFKVIADFNIKIDIISYEELPKMVRIETIKTI